MKTTIFFLAILLLSSVNLFSQNKNSQQWLRNFADKQNEDYKQQKAIADSIAELYNMPIKTVYPDGTEIELQGFKNGIPFYYKTDNLNAAKTTSTNLVWEDLGLGIFDLTGSSQFLGVWDGGAIRTTHQEFGGRVTQMDGATSLTDHGTHVSGTMIGSGVDPDAHGMSYNAELHAYSFGNDLSEITTAAANGLKVSNHSYGGIAGWYLNYFGDGLWAWFGDTQISETEDYQFGFYSNSGRNWDNLIYNAPYLLVCKSAGNDRNDGGPSPGSQHWVYEPGSGWVLSNTVREGDGGDDGFDSINDGVKCAKNIFTVGAVNDIPDGYSEPSDVSMSSFSNWGPTDDGRIKPDIVSNGVSLFSAGSGSDADYSVKSGTSMAAPNTSGSVGLLLEHQSNLYGSQPFLSSTMKGILLHTAHEAGQFTGPDYIFGWGLLNTFGTAGLMKLDSEIGGNVLIREMTLNQGDDIEFNLESAGLSTLKVTICWIDPPGNPTPPQLDPEDLMLINDLDLRLTSPDFTEYEPWTLDPSNPSGAATTGDNFRDNVEQVFIENPVTGIYTVSISHKGNLENSSQDVSIIISGIDMETPGDLSLLEPADGSGNVSITPVLKWEVAERTIYYHLQIATDPSFKNIVVDNEKINGVIKQVEELPGLTTYYWRVRAWNSGGFGNWSDTWSFTTEISVPAAPILIYPEDDQEHLPITLTVLWESTDFAETYGIEVSQSAFFSTIYYSEDGISDTTLQLEDLPEGDKLYWHVNSSNVTGTSPYSDNFAFITRLNKPDSLKVENVEPNKVMLNWIDNSENENLYHIIRKETGSSYIKIDSIAENETSYLDSTVAGETEYSYRIYASNSEAVSDTSNEATITTLISGVNDNNQLPDEFSLYQNYPNPFNPATTIKFAIAKESNVKITIYNAIGEVVDRLFNGVKSAGYQQVLWNANDKASGIYFYEITAIPLDGSQVFNKTLKMILLR